MPRAGAVHPISGGRWLALVTDRGPLSLDNIDEPTALANRRSRRLEFIVAVPARRHAGLLETLRALILDDAGLAEASFAGHRPILARDPGRAEDQTSRRARIAELQAVDRRAIGTPFPG